MRAYLNRSDGKKQDYQVKVTESVWEDVHAVYINSVSQYPLDSEFGAVIEIPLQNVTSWMADYRNCEWWCQPEFGAKLSEIPDETQGFIYEKEDGIFGIILPVVSEQYKCVLKGTVTEEGNEVILAKLFSWYEGLAECKALAFLYAEGENPYELLEKCTSYGMKLLGTGYRTRKERRYPEIFDYLGWCSWDAFEIRVDEESLIAKCQEFQDKNIPIKWAILDDMWGEVRDFYGQEYDGRKEMIRLMHSSKLYSFQADPIRFPNGLKKCIDKINDYGIQVGIWHPTTGYWRGIDPNGEIYRDHKDCLIQTDDGRYIHSPEKAKAYEFYSAFHDYLRRCGAEFIKIDNQSMTRRFYKKIAPVGKVARDFHDAMEASVGQHFDNQMINCMGMASEDMWNRSVSPISRCSNDFLPEDSAWFVKHIMQCAYNCLIQGQFYYCDWDMWWTDDGQAEKNSILRAISGGPIYVSDTLGRSRAEVLKPLIFENGRILRCDNPAMPTKDCLTKNPTNSGKIFKLWNVCNGCGILAVFNLDADGGSVMGSISPSDIVDLAGTEFAVYEHFSKECLILNTEGKLELHLESSNEYKLYIFVPLQNGCGMIGRTDKFISPATYRRCSNGEVEFVEGGPYAYVENYQLILKDR